MPNTWQQHAVHSEYYVRGMPVNQVLTLGSSASRGTKLANNTAT